MKRLDAVSFISHGLAKDPNYSKSKLDQGTEENEHQNNNENRMHLLNTLLI